MNKNFIQQIEHQPVEPVKIERDANDVVIIEGVRYSGDYFRTLAVPDPNVLYTVRRDDDQVWLTTIRNIEEAEKFFTPHPALPHLGEHKMGEEGYEDAV